MGGWAEVSFATLNFSFTFAGLALFVFGVGWQAIEWGLIDLVKVDLLAGASDREHVVTGPLKSFNEHGLSRRGFYELFFVVRARNVGRKAVHIHRWKILTSKGWGYSLEEFHLNPKLPHRLEPGSDVLFYVPMEQVLAASYAAFVLRGLVNQICATVRLASGGVRRSKKHKLPTISCTQCDREDLVQNAERPDLVKRSA